MGELSKSARDQLVARFQRLDRSWSSIQRSDDLHELKRGIDELHVDDVACLPLWIRVWGLDRQSEIESIELGLRSDVELALASFSADGYIRAAAIGALCRSRWRLARAFVMIRLADWVPQVTELAWRATRSWMSEGAAGETVAEWAVFASICRRDVRGRAMELLDELCSAPDRGAVWMIEQVNASGRGADAAWVVGQILSRTADRASLVPHFVRSPFSVVRVIGAQTARTTGEFLVTPELMDVLSNDPSPSVRREAVYLLERAEDGIARSALITLAGDRSTAVRQSALYYLDADSVRTAGSSPGRRCRARFRLRERGVRWISVRLRGWTTLPSFERWRLMYEHVCGWRRCWRCTVLTFGKCQTTCLFSRSTDRRRLRGWRFN